ncbi:hypothetical protein FE391_29610 [Nonomuraea sp. KC401]|uniref:hypothetical protein n=1 Tax=unclassified Nonomuraea TaxID=2593643 RepID=UPI0010FE5BF6|nr:MULTISPECIES: hypothetical protein [unclassified Nonomuraea]NBE97475.1 hypothetical protein [Nonomuraea sp. K271]TLF62728.1 hypothetical protein FE391_29610 [Nonomuraea sp. KC401]
MSQPSSMPADDRFHSAHVPELCPGFIRLTWDPVWAVEKRIRVCDYTCDCVPTFYELCQAGGQYFIRRTRRVGGEVLVDQSALGGRAQTFLVWIKVLTGVAA